MSRDVFAEHALIERLLRLGEIQVREDAHALAKILVAGVRLLPSWIEIINKNGGWFLTVSENEDSTRNVERVIVSRLVPNFRGATVVVVDAFIVALKGAKDPCAFLWANTVQSDPPRGWEPKIEGKDKANT